MNYLVGVCAMILLTSPAIENLPIRTQFENIVTETTNDNIVAVKKPEYENLKWIDLRSENEIHFYYEELAKQMADHTYPGGTPPEPIANVELNNKKVKITGYAVGVDTVPGEYNKVSSFLFVPYAGACIHVPPPPANQTIYVEMKKPVKTDPYEAIVLEGTIYVEEGEDELASYFYTIKGDRIKKYK